jgi:hypothetical protein
MRLPLPRPGHRAPERKGQHRGAVDVGLIRSPAISISASDGNCMAWVYQIMPRPFFRGTGPEIDHHHFRRGQARQHHCIGQAARIAGAEHLAGNLAEAGRRILPNSGERWPIVGKWQAWRRA